MTDAIISEKSSGFNSCLYCEEEPLCGCSTVYQLEIFHSTCGVLQSLREQPHSCLSRVIVAEVQLSQMRGVGPQSGGQRGTAFLCDPTTRQPVEKRVFTKTKDHAAPCIATCNCYRRCCTISDQLYHEARVWTNTSISPAYILNSPVQQRAAALLNPAGRSD